LEDAHAITLRREGIHENRVGPLLNYRDRVAGVVARRRAVYSTAVRASAWVWHRGWSSSSRPSLAPPAADYVPCASLRRSGVAPRASRSRPWRVAGVMVISVDLSGIAGPEEGSNQGTEAAK